MWTMKTPRSQKRLHFHALSMILVRMDVWVDFNILDQTTWYSLSWLYTGRKNLKGGHATHFLPEVLISQKWRLPCASSRALPLTEGSPFISLLLPDKPHSAHRAFGEEAFPPIWQGAVSFYSRACFPFPYFYKSGTKHKSRIRQYSVPKLFENL